MTTIRTTTIAALLIAVLFPSVAHAEDAPPPEEKSDLERAIDRVSVAGVAAAVYQYQFMNDDYDDLGRGTIIVEPEVSFALSEEGLFFLKFGFGAGDSLAGESDFMLAPWGGNEEGAYQDINGRNRDYLLTAWYRHAFALGENDDDGEIAVTGGIIDSTDYLDGNAYANDEYTQFMNGVFVNAHAHALASFDLGVAAEADFDGFHVNFVGMQVGDNGNGRSFHFYGLEAGVTLEFGDLGEGNYRVTVTGTTEKFVDENGDDAAYRGVCLSFDQQLGETLGVFLRAGGQADDALIDYETLLSFGLNLSGALWEREGDEIGIGVATLGGGNMEFGRANVFEIYGNVRLDEHLFVTLDVQYQTNEVDGVPNPKGWVIGGRVVVEF